MPFPRNVIDEARRKAHYKCVICHEPFVDVHHITPESEGGSNTLDNAASLCAGCHDTYGNNPDKRRQVKEMRDLWYELCETRYSGLDIESYKKLSELYEMTKTVKEDQAKSQAILSEIKATLSGTLSSTANAIGNLNTLSAVKQTSGYVTGTMLGPNVYANVRCRKCNSFYGLLVGTNKCPNCKEPIQ